MRPGICEKKQARKRISGLLTHRRTGVVTKGPARVVKYGQRGEGMAKKKQLSTRKKNQIIADYVRTESYSATARLHGVSPNTVKRLVKTRPEVAEMCEVKKRADAREVAQYMDEQKKLVCEIIGNGLNALADPEKLRAASPRDIATTIGILSDKWTAIGGEKNAGVKITVEGGDEAWRK